MKVNQIQVSRVSVATTILTLGMMGSLAVGILFGGTALAATAPSVSADIPNEQDQEQASTNDATAPTPYYYGPSTSESSTPSHAGGEDATLMIQSGNKNVTVNTNQQTNSSNITPETADPAQHTYPSFSNEEINQLFNVETMPVEDGTVPPVEEPKQPAELEYLEETAQVYRHVPVNPVYTYGKDEEGKGACAGTEEFCAKSEELWKNFEEKIANDESITHTEGEQKGQLIMPEPYKEHVKNMPAVKPGECPEGYEPYPWGNEEVGVEKPHCGKLEDNTYRVAPLG